MRRASVTAHAAACADSRKASPAFLHAFPRATSGFSSTALLLPFQSRHHYRTCRQSHPPRRPRRSAANIVFATAADASDEPVPPFRNSSSPARNDGESGTGGADNSNSGAQSENVSMSASNDAADPLQHQQSPSSLQPPSSNPSSSSSESSADAPPPTNVPVANTATSLTQNSEPVSAVPSTSTPTPEAGAALRSRFKVQRRILVGFIMGAVVIYFVFSGRWSFALGMLAISLCGLYEYYRMVQAKGHLPAYKMGLGVTAATMLASAAAPAVADIAFPVGGTFICIYLLFRRSKIATIADISTTFMGLFYAGYLPSYWVRLHGFVGSPADNAVASAVTKLWPSFFGLGPTITPGALTVFWTWLAAASADIAAFFFGRTFGRTRFSNISPKKTVEGAIAGFLCSAGVSVLGAYLLQWPLWWATGAIYGITVGVLGLCGDLFESCFKRDVGWKDSGSLFPGHGGVLDRADSYVLVAPLVYFFVTHVLPVIAR